MNYELWWFLDLPSMAKLASLGVMSYQLSVISYQLSVISYQLSVKIIFL
jgi:hypothetical protein